MAYFKQLIILFQRADAVVEVFECYDDDTLVNTAELNRCTGTTAPCKQFHKLVGAVLCALYLHGRVS